MEAFLSAEEEAELGIIVRAAHDLFEKALKGDRPAASIVAALVEGLVRTALLRAKEDRRMSYLDQWRQFLSWLPSAVESTAEREKPAIAERALRQFRLRDGRGKRKPVPSIPGGANCLLMKDGELWYAKVPFQDLSVVPDHPLIESGTTLDQGDQTPGSETVSSAIRTEHGVYLRPFCPPGVLKRGYNRLLRSLPPAETETGSIAESEEEIATTVSDVPAARLRRWLREGVTRSDLALLIAAYRTGLTAKVSNLPHLHTDLHWAKL